MKQAAITFILLTIATTAYALDGKVISITDGDTIEVLTADNTLVKVRLYGIDTPEPKQPYGKVSTRHMKHLAAGKQVYVEEFGTDRYKRLLGIVFVGDTNINRAMVEAGQAWVYRKYCKKVFCAEWYDLEYAAKDEGRGLFADPHAVPPWEWRKRKRKAPK